MVLSARCGLEAWMNWSCIDVIVLGFKSVEELYPSPSLGVDSADTSGNIHSLKCLIFRNCNVCLIWIFIFDIGQAQINSERRRSLLSLVRG